MIDEATTYKTYGYTSSTLSTGSNKRVAVVCNECMATVQRQFVHYNNNRYPDLCRMCAQKRVYIDDPTIRDRKSESMTKHHAKHTWSAESMTKHHAKHTWSAESRQKMSLSMKKHFAENPISEKAIKRICDASEKYFVEQTNRERHSATRQGQDYDAGEWTGFATQSSYCEKFNKSCREQNRKKYDNHCFICNKPQSENITKLGEVRKLSVHHVDLDREQGCDGHKWQLVPLCMKCHQGKAHTSLWQSRIEYLLRDEQPYHLSDRMNASYTTNELRG